jgi:hypothetical protein
MNKIFLLLTDGVGLRNFIYTDFINHTKQEELVIWHNLPNDILPKNIKKVKLPKIDQHPLLDVFKVAKNKSELNTNQVRFSDPNYQSYWFPPNDKGLKNLAKSLLSNFLAYNYQGVEGSKQLWHKIKSLSRQSSYYRQCIDVLRQEKPSVVFCTHQRISQVVAPIEAAKSLGIPTACFIFSWDNLPKGSLLVDADYFLVWSNYMKEEMLKYYPYINQDKIIVTGTPQFTLYFNKDNIVTKEQFAITHGLDPAKEFICFSGDDVTTSPYDPDYLEDTILAVQQLNQNGDTQYQVLFRRCPVDMSSRYDHILKNYAGDVVAVNPRWSAISSESSWSNILPLAADNDLLANTVAHSSLVINLGSTMALDFTINGKTACYIAYNIDDQDRKWNVERFYNYVHFQVMHRFDPVYFIKDRKLFADTISNALADTDNRLKRAQQWAQHMVLHPLEKANERFFNTLLKIATNG